MFGVRLLKNYLMVISLNLFAIIYEVKPTIRSYLYLNFN